MGKGGNKSGILKNSSFQEILSQSICKLLENKYFVSKGCSNKTLMDRIMFFLYLSLRAS